MDAPSQAAVLVPGIQPAIFSLGFNIVQETWSSEELPLCSTQACPVPRGAAGRGQHPQPMHGWVTEPALSQNLSLHLFSVRMHHPSLLGQIWWTQVGRQGMDFIYLGFGFFSPP